MEKKEKSPFRIRSNFEVHVRIPRNWTESLRKGFYNDCKSADTGLEKKETK